MPQNASLCITWTCAMHLEARWKMDYIGQIITWWIGRLSTGNDTVILAKMLYFKFETLLSIYLIKRNTFSFLFRCTIWSHYIIFFSSKRSFKYPLQSIHNIHLLSRSWCKFSSELVMYQFHEIYPQVETSDLVLHTSYVMFTKINRHMSKFCQRSTLVKGLVWKITFQQEIEKRFIINSNQQDHFLKTDNDQYILLPYFSCPKVTGYLCFIALTLSNKWNCENRS